MSFKNSPIPQCLFKDDASMLGAEKKAEFLHKLEGLVPEPKVHEVNSDAVIIDDHAVIRRLLFHSTSTTFGENAKQFVTYLRNHSKNGSEIYVVFDRYHDGSTKGGTREKRGNFSNPYIVSADKHIPQNCKSFLESSENKTSLALPASSHSTCKKTSSPQLTKMNSYMFRAVMVTIL